MGKVGNVCVKLFELDVININGGSLYFFKFNNYVLLGVMNYELCYYYILCCYIRNIIKIIFFCIIYK